MDRAIKNLQAAAIKIKKAEADKAERQREANLKTLSAMMKEMGLSAADVRDLSGTKAKKNAPTDLTKPRKRAKKAAKEAQRKAPR